MNTLPGIIEIRYCRCADLEPSIMLRGITAGQVAVAVDTVPIRFYGIPKCQWEGTVANGVREEKTTLEFMTAERLPEGERLAFIITCWNGRQIIIGTREPKYPQVTYTDTTGSPTGDPALRTYKITHLAAKSAVDCVY